MILAVGLGLTALLPSTTLAAGIRVSTATPPAGGAVGLVVIGRGKAVPTAPAGDSCPCEITIYLRLPMDPHEPARFPIRIVGGDYRGLLVSDSTRVPGLVSISDLEPTVRAIERGEEPPVTSRPDADPERTVHELDLRLTQVHESGRWAYWILGLSIATFTLAALLLRSALWGRAALLAAPAVMSATLALSALELSRPRTVAFVLLATVAVGVPLLAVRTEHEHVLGLALLAIFAVYAVVFLVSSETVSLAAIGPHPEGGGRFYGLTNLMETLLLVPGLLGAALLGRRAVIPVGLAVLVVVGASRLGADGGGVLVFAAGLAFLWLGLRRVPFTTRTLLLAGAGVVALGLALVGLDAALGGSSHVTRSLGDGPGALAGDIAHRWNVSIHGLVASTSAIVLISAGAAVLLWAALHRPRHVTVDAALVALAVSLLVNDSPRDVVTWGALSCAALCLWKDARPVQ